MRLLLEAEMEWGMEMKLLYLIWNRWSKDRDNRAKLQVEVEMEASAQEGEREATTEVRINRL